MSLSFQNLVKAIIFEKKDFILSNTQYKRILLTGQLSLISFTACLLYIAFDLAFGIYYAWPYQAACALIIMVGWYCNRIGKHALGIMIAGIGINLTVFVFSSIEHISTGLYMFYMTIAIGAFAIFGHEDRRKAMFIAALSIVFFFLTLFTKLDFLPRSTHGETYVRINLVFNFLVSCIASLLIIRFMLAIHHRSETSLIENEKKIVAQNEELTKINSELDRFVYSTSHDLRAPLSSIRGLILLTERESDPSEMKQYIAMMKTRVNNLDKFITDISDYSRNSRTEIVKISTPVKKVIRDVLENLRYYPGSDSVKIELNVPDELLIVTDPMRLQMVLGNLISNAFKYYDPDKEDCYIKISVTCEDALLNLIIEDNGIGISPELVPRIFDMFFQAHEKSTGSGLGLYIVKETVQKLGGTIAVESAVNIGTKFTVKLFVN